MVLLFTRSSFSEKQALYQVDRRTVSPNTVPGTDWHSAHVRTTVIICCCGNEQIKYYQIMLCELQGHINDSK